MRTYYETQGHQPGRFTHPLIPLPVVEFSGLVSKDDALVVQKTLSHVYGITNGTFYVSYLWIRLNTLSDLMKLYINLLFFCHFVHQNICSFAKIHSPSLRALIDP